MGHTATNLINHMGHDCPFQVRDAELGMNAREVSNDHSYIRFNLSVQVFIMGNMG